MAAVDSDLFRLMLDRLVLSQVRAAKLLKVTPRALRYWGSGTNPWPGWRNRPPATCSSTAKSWTQHHRPSAASRWCSRPTPCIRT
jgi:hypothetical protein